MQNGTDQPTLIAVHTPNQFIDTSDSGSQSTRSLYSRHRNDRDTRLHTLLLQQPPLSADPLLAAMLHSNDDTLDQRHNLALVARPPSHVIALITTLQQQLHVLAGDALWLPSPRQLHMTVYEVTHSRTSRQLQPLVATVRGHRSELCCQLPIDRVKLDSPLLNYDTSAVAITFLPIDVDGYDIARLRAEVGGRLAGMGIEWDGRYVAPTAHITIGRFVESRLRRASMEQWLAKLDELSTVQRMGGRVVSGGRAAASDDWFIVVRRWRCRHRGSRQMRASGAAAHCFACIAESSRAAL